MLPFSLLARLDAFRFPYAARVDRVAHKEWLHFCVHGPGVDAIVNFSVTGSSEGAARAQVTALVREEQWDGDVEAYAEEDVVFRRDRLGATFGKNRLELSGERYEIAVTLAERPISMSLSLRPTTLPLSKRQFALGSAGSLHWLLVPRLVAAGTIVVSGRTHRFEGAPAYHDHNWGRFAWGGDFAWEWGYGLPASAGAPWSVVFSRLADRGHHEMRTQALLLWRGAKLHRVLASRDIVVQQEGYLRPRRVLKVPRVMALLAPETATDVPRRIDIHAAAEGDELHLRFEAEEVAQIILPNDHDLGITIINEIRGFLRLNGVVRGERVFMEGHAIFERVSA
ncbi:hypothetical protein [Polyangium sp. 6x1]|uniref:hypothetical protein n=1 Tax=Polyangium sp. 6x1 TaxID=3042689 RepID=UPI0024832C18|nr:hypothetical protein [Polyangium sp. 6x1]MDI1443539.1 hypothetical protein [Polyangium sp. 6x1]